MSIHLASQHQLGTSSI